MELARAWFTSSVPTAPAEVTTLLEGHPLTKGILFTEGRPEYVTPLPERGEGRNHDLWIRARTDRPVTLCVEAKADEPFGDLVSEVWAGSTDGSGKPIGGSRKAQRLEALLALLFGAEADPGRPPWSDMRYQLITAAAGTVIQAVKDQADLAVLLVHEFLTAKVDRAEKVPQNEADFALFVSALTRVQREEIRTGVLCGPVTIPRSQHLAHDVGLLVGKVVFDWTTGRQS